jgi:hypothetical protein
MPMPVQENTLTLRTRNVSKEQPIVTPADPNTRTQIGWLEFGLQSRKHERKGWLKEALVKHELLAETKSAVWARVLSDYACTEAARDGMEQALGDKYKDPREHKGVTGKASSGRFVSVKKASQIGIPKNMWTLGYLTYAYNVDEATFRRRWRAAKAGQQKSGKHIGTL